MAKRNNKSGDFVSKAAKIKDAEKTNELIKAFLAKGGSIERCEIDPRFAEYYHSNAFEFKCKRFESELLAYEQQDEMKNAALREKERVEEKK